MKSMKSMKRPNESRIVMALAFFATLALMLPGAVAQEVGEETVVEGEVVQIRNQVRTHSGGEVQQIMVRTRQGEMKQLQLGDPSACTGECLQVGDQVRARVMTQTRTQSRIETQADTAAASAGDVAATASGEALAVRSMKVRRTGQELTFRDASGDLLRTRSRAKDGTGAGSGDRMRTRDQIHEPGTGGGSGSGTRGGSRGGGRGGRGGGGR